MDECEGKVFLPERTILWSPDGTMGYQLNDEWLYGKHMKPGNFIPIGGAEDLNHSFPEFLMNLFEKTGEEVIQYVKDTAWRTTEACK